MALNWYVYTLEDPRTREVFYVGKGQGTRALQHLRGVLDGDTINQRKVTRIQALLAIGLQPRITIIQQFERESDALACEDLLIASHPAHQLTNVIGNTGGAYEAKVHQLGQLHYRQALLEELGRQRLLAAHLRRRRVDARATRLNSARSGIQTRRRAT